MVLLFRDLVTIISTLAWAYVISITVHAVIALVGG